MFKASIFAAVIPALAVLAQVTPSEPAPGNVYNEGAGCNIEWDADTTGHWTTMNIELMTGSNTDMVHLTTVATVDGTSQKSYSYTCPSVSPNSAIYFYQFSSPSQPTNLTWTGRFAIADASGNTVGPTDEADGIKFGTGALTDPSSASPAPSYLNGAVVTTSASTSASGASSSATVSSSTTVQTVISTSVTGALTATGSLTTSARSTAATSGGASGSSSSTSSAASSSSSSTSGASALVLNFKARGLQALVGLAGTAFVFATML